MLTEIIYPILYMFSIHISRMQIVFVQEKCL